MDFNFRFTVRHEGGLELKLPPELVHLAKQLLRNSERILEGVQKIMQSEQDTLIQLQAIKDAQTATNAVLDKVSGETTGLVTLSRDQADLIVQLQEQVANLPTTVPQSVSDLIAELASNATTMKDKAEGIDRQVDDVAPNPTPTPPADGDDTADDTATNP